MEIPKALEGLPESREFFQFGRGWEGEGGGLVWWEEGVTYCLNGPPSLVSLLFLAWSVLQPTASFSDLPSLPSPPA